MSVNSGSSGNSLVRRLLRRNISTSQLVGFAAANLVGLLIVLTALQFYRDVTATWDDEDSFISRDYLIISKHIGGLGSFMGGTKSTFSEAEISDLEAQPWSRRVGKFSSAGFNVNASVNMGGNTLGTALFLEAIPSDFFDVKPENWTFAPGQRQPLPVIISKDYLTLYNFGFATSRGLPQISESMIGMVPLKLSLSGNGMQQYVDARVVGFSSRLNTIAVPEEFMDWANASFAEKGAESQPSRLIVEVSSPGDPAVNGYMDAHGYEIAGDKVDNGRAAFFLSVVTTIVVAVGVVISALAFFILLLSIFLLLQKNRLKMHQLMLLGYRPGDISKQYDMLVVIVNLFVLVVASSAVAFASGLWQKSLGSIGAESASIWPTLLVGLCIVAVITVGSVLAINRSVKRVFRL